MRIVFYSQHVLGVGHLFRSLEIAAALAPHQVDLITGGEHVPVTLPPHVQHVPLPPLCMDADFQGLQTARPTPSESHAPHAPETSHSSHASHSPEAVLNERRQRLLEHVRKARPDLFLVELFPFGRKRFGVELLPVLEAIRQGGLGRSRAVCSVRDILVEKRDPAKYEARVVHQLNTLFDLVLVHADPRLVRLDETFSRIQDIQPPIRYTGYVAAPVDAARGARLRESLGLTPRDEMIVASIGGGAVGLELLEAVLKASTLLPSGKARHLWVFTGPFMAEEAFTSLARLAAGMDRVVVRCFTEDFGTWLAAADLSVSMAGYNTTMNLLAAGTFGLVRPFAQNREQTMRAQRLERFGVLSLLHPEELVPERLAQRMVEALDRTGKDRTGAAPGRPSEGALGIDLDGAAATGRILENFASGRDLDV